MIFSFADLIFQITAGSTLKQSELDAEKLPMHPWGQARFVPGSRCSNNPRMQNDPELCCSSTKAPCETLDQKGKFSIFQQRNFDYPAHSCQNQTDHGNGWKWIAAVFFATLCWKDVQRCVFVASLLSLLAGPDQPKVALHAVLLCSKSTDLPGP